MKHGAGLHNGNWVDEDRAERGESDGLGVADEAELKRLRSEIAEL